VHAADQDLPLLSLEAIGMTMVVTAPGTGFWARSWGVSEPDLRSQDLPFSLPLMPVLIGSLAATVVGSKETIYFPSHGGFASNCTASKLSLASPAVGLSHSKNEREVYTG
jgi:hypothetical protein